MMRCGWIGCGSLVWVRGEREPAVLATAMLWLVAAVVAVVVVVACAVYIVIDGHLFKSSMQVVSLHNTHF